ncbi:hypothetical protein DLAC_04705 [Tieghemostelium lacteum]|uniref:Peptidase M28 domain-containing protein n=1 Tax=Tieghemostelium lacteum TaxID=361077 RepID=A0A151ZKF3_TIELA|nr:hypothetical protein DLAC_04705 [Tieghemostelium lacteum]|eukprot:KYQ94407.1 hypothetical protein DLAC_04705 [Tieghemostelium lacteum]
MFRQSVGNRNGEEIDDSDSLEDGEELQVINLNTPNNQQQGNHSDVEEDEDDDQEDHPNQSILHQQNTGDGDGTGHRGGDNREDPRNQINSMLGYCFSKQFLKGISMIVGFLGLILTIVLLANALVSVKHQDSSSNEKQNYVNTQLPLWVLDSVSLDRAKSHVKYLSSDLLQGRGTGTPGEELTVDYVQSVFSSAYLQPFSDVNSTSYIQNVPLFAFNCKALSNMSIAQSGVEKLSLGFLNDFIATSQVKQAFVNLTDVPLIFIGYGIDSDHFLWDDYKGVNVSGKVVISLVGYPQTQFQGINSTYTQRWTYKFEEASKQGALGILLIHTDISAGYPWTVLQSSALKEQMQLDLDNQVNPLHLAGWITHEMADNIAKLSGFSLDQWQQISQTRQFQPLSLGLTMNLSMSYPDSRLVNGSNVVSIIKGSTQPNEYVVVMAHHDHLGEAIDPKTNKTLVFHGAIDNASGVTTLLETASILGLYNKFLHSSTFSETLPSIGTRAFNRSVVFVSTTAEEHGLYGSLYFLLKGPIQKLNGTIVSVINFDVVNVYGQTNDTMAFGLGMSQELDHYLEEVCQSENMTTTGDPRPTIGFLYRNDQLNFLLANIPAITFGFGSQFLGQPYPQYFNTLYTTYFQQHYHQPSDQFDDSWPFTGTVQQIRLASRLAFYLSSSQTPLPTLQNKIV